MKAVILGAGEGTRLEPLTNVRPKPMLPIANKPLLEYVVEAVGDAGITDIVFVVGYKRERIQNHFGDGHHWDADIEYVFQSPQLGTGDAIVQARNVVGEDFLVLNGDRIVESRAISEVRETYEKTGNPAVAVSGVDEPSLYGVVETGTGNRIKNIAEKPLPRDITSNQINAGVYAFGQEIFAAIDQTESHGELAITDTLNQHSDHLHPTAVPYGGQWLDVSRPWDLLTVNGRVLDHQSTRETESASIADSARISDHVALAAGATINDNVSIQGGTSIGENTTVGTNAIIENSIILSDVTIDPGAILKDVIIGQNASIGPGTVIEGGQADVTLDDTVHRDVPFGGIIGDNATVGANVTVLPGTRLGNDATVQSACTLEGDIAPGTRFECR